MTKEQLEIDIRNAVITNGYKPEYYGMSGCGIIHPATLTAVINFIMPLYQQIDELKTQAGLKVK